MKKVLVLTYYMPPCNGAPAWRPYSWAQNFHQHGWYPVVVSRHWRGDESTWEDFLKDNHQPISHEVHEGYELYSLPTKRFLMNDILDSKGLHKRVLANLYYFFLGLVGRFNSEIDADLTFRKFVFELIGRENFDAIIVTSPPSVIMRLIPDIQRKTSAVVVADVRDLWNNMLLRNNYQPSLKQRIWDFLYAAYYKKWLKKVDAITVIVDQFVPVMEKLSPAPVEVIYNGYESYLFERVERDRNDKFYFSVVGNIYPEQDISIMLKGLSVFLSDKLPEQVNVRFIGVDSYGRIGDEVRAAIPPEFLTITGRVSKDVAVYETANATVLSYPGWKGVKGIISTKVFDYIASGNPIVIVPGDGDILDELVADAGTGKSVDEVHDFVALMELWYKEWKEGGDVPRAVTAKKSVFTLVRIRPNVCLICWIR